MGGEAQYSSFYHRWKQKIDSSFWGSFSFLLWYVWVGRGRGAEGDTCTLTSSVTGEGMRVALPLEGCRE